MTERSFLHPFRSYINLLFAQFSVPMKKLNGVLFATMFTLKKCIPEILKRKNMQNGKKNILSGFPSKIARGHMIIISLIFLITNYQ